MECRWNLSLISALVLLISSKKVSWLKGSGTSLRRPLGACLLAVALGFAILPGARAADFDVSVEQITFGKKHHFFGYIGQCRTIPWNSSGRYIVALRTDFHDRMPKAGEAADVVLVDTTQRNRVLPIEKCRAGNFQQGTMFYWNPKKPETQFFFNDRDPQTGRVFTVLYDVEKRERVREFRYEDASFGNGGVAQGGGAFLGLNYGRMARLRPVTGYPGAFDWTQGVNAPTDDGVFKVDTETGEKRVLVSFRQLADLLRPRHPNIDDIPLFINHTLWNRDDNRIYFYARGNWGRPGPTINVPCTVKSDGTGLTMHDTFIGGHPEWGEGNQVIGSRDDRQVLYDVDRKEIVGQIGTPEVLPKPGGDVSYSPDGKWFVNGYKDGSKNYYVIIRLSDGAHVRTPGIDKGSYSDDLRIDPAPRWNRSSDAILVPGVVEGGIRQMFLIRIRPANALVSNWLGMDKDGDKKITKDEAKGQLKTSFDRNDADKNGFLIRSELEALAQRRRSGRNQRTNANRNQPTMSMEDLLKRTPGGVTVLPDIAYREGNEAWKLDLAMPKERGDAPRSSIVFIHGGGWTKGDKRGQGIGAVLDYAAKGYVCISINYRLDVDKKACVEDVKCATRWLRAHAEQYNLDPDRIGAVGNSAGGHLALMLAVCPASAGLEGDGPYQKYSSMVQSAHCSSTPIMPRFRKGKGSNQDVRKIQPMTYISADVPPLYLIHGASDQKAPVSYVDDFVKALREAGAKDITYKRYTDGTGHGAYVKHIEEARPAREAFFARTLMKKGDKDHE